MTAPSLRHILLALMLIAVTTPVVRAGDAAVEYLQRVHRVNQQDATELAKLADWAKGQGLNQQAAELYRKALVIDPEFPGAYESLAHIGDTTRLPDEPEVVEALMKEFPADQGFSVHAAPHFIVVYNTDKAWALNRAVLLERTHDTYFQNFRRAGLKPLPLERRLVCILLDTHEQFTAYAKKTDGVTLSWSSGYYSTLSNRIAFFNDEDNPQFKETREEMQGLEKQIVHLDEQITEASRRKNFAVVTELRRQKGDVRKRLRWYQNRHTAVAGLANAAKTTHEAVHQLAFNTGLQARGVQYPFWLSEGLATNFEAENSAANFGPFHDNSGRRLTLKDARDEKQLTPLAELVSIISPSGDDVDRIANMYAEVWGLFQFLFKRRHEQMQEYLRSLSELPPGLRDEAAMKKEFEDAFGPIEQLEAQWKLHLKTLR